jgi:hypothetical protein
MFEVANAEEDSGTGRKWLESSNDAGPDISSPRTIDSSAICQLVTYKSLLNMPCKQHHLRAIDIHSSDT